MLLMFKTSRLFFFSYKIEIVFFRNLVFILFGSKDVKVIQKIEIEKVEVAGNCEVE